MVKEIVLTKGKVAIVDDEDYDRINQFKWSYSTYGYAVRNGKYVNGKREKAIYMHRQIFGEIAEDEVVDHIDRNKLNNQKANLRKCTRKENSYNKKFNPKSSRYSGVSWHQKTKKWQCSIGKDYSTIYIGLFTSEQAAANAYNHYASELYGEYACLNNVEPMDDWSKYKFEPPKTSEYIGVSYDKRNEKWFSCIVINNKTISLGRYSDEILAAEAYDNKVIAVNLDRKINFPKEVTL